MERKYYAIYSFECQKEGSVNSYKPGKTWELTESYWKDGMKHRKYTKIISKAELDKLANEQYLFCEGIQTMGSLTEIGWLPAISFTGQSDFAQQCLYISPLPHPNNGQIELFSNEEVPFDIDKIEQSFWIEYGTKEVYENNLGIA